MHEGNFSTLTYFSALGMRSERTAPKNREPTVGFSFTTMLQHTGLFWFKNFLTKKNLTTMGHPPHSPDLPAADFYLFTQLKPALKARGFCDATEIIKNATKELKRLWQNGFQEYLRHLYSRWQKCRLAQGKYFDGNVA